MRAAQTLMCTRVRRSFNAVGTQSAVLAGFAMTSFAEIDLPHNAFYAQKASAPAALRPHFPRQGALASKP